MKKKIILFEELIFYCVLIKLFLIVYDWKIILSLMYQIYSICIIMKNINKFFHPVYVLQYV